MFFRVIYYLSIAAFLFTGAVATANEQAMVFFISFAINLGVLTIYKLYRVQHEKQMKENNAVLRIFPNIKDPLSKEDFMKNSGFDFSKVNKYLGDHEKYYPDDYLYLMGNLDEDELKEYYSKFSVEERSKHTIDRKEYKYDCKWNW